MDPREAALSVIHQLRTPPAEATPRRRDRTRAALIRAGEQLMADRSVDAVSIDDIVEAAGVAKGTFYNPFPDKDTLRRDALEHIRTDTKATIAQFNAQVTDPARRVARALCAVLRYALEQPRRGHFLTRTSMAFRLIEDRVNERLIQDVGIGLTEGRFVIVSTESGALPTLGITHAPLVQTLDDTSRFSITARAQQMGAMLLRGLGLPHDEAEMIAAQEPVMSSARTILPRRERAGDAVLSARLRAECYRPDASRALASVISRERGNPPPIRRACRVGLTAPP